MNRLRSQSALLAFLLMLLFWGACSKDSEPTLPTEKEFLSFQLSKELNEIPITSVAVIEDHQVTLFLPPGTPTTDLIPEFETPPRTSVYIGDEILISGVTVLDFSNLITATIYAEDGTSKDYRLQLTTDFGALDFYVDALMGDYDIPGLQLAIVKDERLVYAKSFGDADFQQDKLVTNESLFRISGVSMPITAIAIFKLADMGLLDIDDRVFGEETLLGTQYGTPPYAQDIQQITVRHLLEHTSGWTNNPSDVMFANLNQSHSELIGHVLDNRPLTTYPGTTEYVLNFGYCVLGRIIEEVAEMPYEQFVQQELLNPIGITAMRIGGNTQAEQYPNEVTYYDQDGSNPYWMNVTRMDSHAGWIASATDLVNFLMHIDHNPERSDLVSSNYLQEMYFGFNYWIIHGVMPGTCASISRLDNSFGYAILTNTRSPFDDEMLDDMNDIMKDEIWRRDRWPTYDLLD